MGRKTKLDIFNSAPAESKNVLPEKDPFVEKTFDEILDMRVSLPANAHHASPALIVSKLNECDDAQKRLYELSCEVNRKIVIYEHLLTLKQAEYDVQEVNAVRDLTVVSEYKISAQDKKTAIKHYTQLIAEDMAQLQFRRDEYRLLAKQIDKKSDEMKNVSIQIQSINKMLSKVIEIGGDRGYSAGPPDSPNSKSLGKDLVDVHTESERLGALLSELELQGESGLVEEEMVPDDAILHVETTREKTALEALLTEEEGTDPVDCVASLGSTASGPSEDDVEAFLDCL